MLQQHFMNITQTLQLKVSAIAKFSGIERTTISRYKSGSRKPSPLPRTIEKLADGILGAANEEGKLSSLAQLLKMPDSENEDHLRKTLVNYLSATLPEDAVDTKNKRSHKEKDVFCERLDASMNLAMISNVRLSRAVNVDASLVSRFRSGSRSPRSNPFIMNKICTTLYERIMAIGRQSELCALLEISEDQLTLETFTAWLFQTNTENTNAAEMAQKILYSLDSFASMPAKQNFTPQQILRPEVLQDQRMVYTGFDGLRSACVRLLTDAVLSDASDLWLYSDFDMSWMTEDKNFWTMWSTLMGVCVQKKIRIHIVHQLNREMGEMLSAILGWLPLYMSGMIDSYYCADVTNVAFTHALFICPGVGVIEACNVSGTEAKGKYRYHTEKEDLAFYREAFSVFMEKTRPLVKVYENAPEMVKRAPIVILPEEDSAARSSVSADAAILLSRDFKNVAISIGDGFVGVTRLHGKSITFFISHPHLVNAFKTYAQMLQSEK